MAAVMGLRQEKIMTAAIALIGSLQYKFHCLQKWLLP